MYVCIYVYACMYAYTYIYLYMQTCTHTYIHTHMHTYTHIHTCMHTYIHTYMYVCLHPTGEHRRKEASADVCWRMLTCAQTQRARSGARRRVPSVFYGVSRCSHARAGRLLYLLALLVKKYTRRLYTCVLQCITLLSRRSPTLLALLVRAGRLLYLFYWYKRRKCALIRASHCSLLRAHVAYWNIM